VDSKWWSSKSRDGPAPFEFAEPWEAGVAEAFRGVESPESNDRGSAKISAPTVSGWSDTSGLAKDLGSDCILNLATHSGNRRHDRYQ
jgi:hypothetical protein